MDYAATAQRARMPSIHKCSHRKVHSSIGDISTAEGTVWNLNRINPLFPQLFKTSERHMNVVYRRRHKDDLWRKEGVEKEEEEGMAEKKANGSAKIEEPEGDDVQLKVIHQNVNA